MAAYNGSQWIGEQISTILNQADVVVKLVVSDDGSSDETRAIVECKLSDGRVEFCSPDKPTGSAAQNFFWLIRAYAADGFDFVAFADQDDLWDETKLSRACSRLRRTGASAYSCAVEAFWPTGGARVLAQVERMTVNDFLFEGAGQGCTFTLSAEFYCRIRRFLTSQVDLSRAVRYHDWAVYMLARAWRVDWAFDRQPMVRYRQHEDNDTGAKTSVRGIAKRVSLIKSGWYGEQIAAIAALAHAAEPSDDLIRGWHELLCQPRSFLRSLRIAHLCLWGGRRRRSDNYVLIVAAMRGWI